MLPPSISIILPCRNPGPAIRDSVNSVLQQSGISLELLVIDGKSSDGTVEWLTDQSHPALRFSSEPDTGIYDAMNKGLRLATGEWLMFLGADDRLASSTILASAIPFLRTEKGPLFCGSVRYADGRVWPAPRRPRPYFRNFIHHQSAFYHRSLFEKRTYDLTYSIQADYDLNLRLWQDNIRPLPLPLEIALCGTGGLSDRGLWQNYREEITIRHRHCSPLRCAGWDLTSLARYLWKKIRRNPLRNRPE